ncbi:MAG: restriction endonuclease subunit S [Acholeplasmatales bacterium]|nr:restriction endonuclease subunit S [Acholeplasmatales bacterium]
MSKMIKVPLSKICDVCKANKNLTKKKLHSMKSLYPVYTANIGVPFEYADFYNNDEPALIAVNDGAAGKCYLVFDEKYVIGKHASGFKPKKELKKYIDLTFLKLVLEPLFIEKNKSKGLGNLPQKDMLSTEFYMPIDDNGNYDLFAQKLIAEKYILLNSKKEALLKQREKIEEFTLEDIDGYKFKEIPLFDMFIPHQGNAIFTKKNINNNHWNGKIPVISSNTDNNGVLDYVDLKYVNEKDLYKVPCLTWSVDGYAGKLFARNLEKNPVGFVPNNHCGVLVPKIDVSDIYFPYLILILQPQFFANAKNANNKKLGNNQMKEIKVSIPLNEDNQFDIDAQKQIAEKFKKVDEIKNDIISKIDDMINTTFEFGV